MDYNPRYICPLTNKLFWEPVVGSDGIVYERMEIKKIIDGKKPSPSPISNQILSKQLYPLLFLAEDIKNFIETNPAARSDQYKPYYKDNIETIKTAIKNQDYLILKMYLEYDVGDMYKNGILIKLLQECPDNILVYIFDNMIGIEYKTKEGWQLVHLICRYCSEHSIQYMLQLKFFNLEIPTVKEELRPIHILCQYSTSEIIKHAFIDLKLNLEVETKDGWRPIHYVCCYGTLDSIQNIIEQNVALNSYIKKYNGSDVRYNASDLLKFNANLDKDETEFITALIQLKRLKSDVKKTKDRMRQSMRGLKKSTSMII